MAEKNGNRGRTSPPDPCQVTDPWSLRAAHRVGDEARDGVRVRVRVRTAILGVPLAVLGDLPRDADRGAAVAHAVAELVVRRRLVLAREAALDVVAVAL